MDIHFNKKVSKKIENRTIENIKKYNMGLHDAFNEAVRELSKKDSELWKAWYYSDFREYIPQEYTKESLNFEKYPLEYKDK